LPHEADVRDPDAGVGMEDHVAIDLDLHLHALVEELHTRDRALLHAPDGNRISLGEIPHLLEARRERVLSLPHAVVLDPGDPGQEQGERDQAGDSDLDGGAPRLVVHAMNRLTWEGAAL